MWKKFTSIEELPLNRNGKFVFDRCLILYGHWTFDDDGTVEYPPRISISYWMESMDDPNPVWRVNGWEELKNEPTRWTHYMSVTDFVQMFPVDKHS
jgi:hypothetical protein